MEGGESPEGAYGDSFQGNREGNERGKVHEAVLSIFRH